MSSSTQNAVIDSLENLGTLVSSSTPDNETVTRNFTRTFFEEDPVEFYQFVFNRTGTLGLSLAGLSNDVNVELIQDTNRNGRVDPGQKC